MLNKIGIALAVAVVFGPTWCASAAPIQEASNHASQYGNPADTPNGPFYVDTYGVPPAVQRHVQQPHRPPPRRH